MNAPPNALQAPPPWLPDAITALRARYPRAAFDVVASHQPNPSTGGYVTVFRMVCGDCLGKMYTLGPGDTLSNFEIHLKNHTHRSRVEARYQPRRSAL